jgi:hypothetical protein
LLALVLIVVGAWAFFPHLAYRIAPTAFVNSELVQVTAPIAAAFHPISRTEVRSSIAERR